MEPNDRQKESGTGQGSAATPSPRRHLLSRPIRWLMNVLAIFALAWTAYCIYAWVTHSGIWQLVWNIIAAHQRGTPDSQSVAMISWGIGLAVMLVVGWPALQLLRRHASRG